MATNTAPRWLVTLVCLALAACGGEDGNTGGADAATDAPTDATAGGDGAASDATPPATEGELSALTYNVKGLPAAITGWDTGAKMTLIAPKLDAFDLVGLQEDFVQKHHDALVAKATHPHKDWFSAKKDATDAPGQHNYGSGLSLLSRFAVLATNHEHYASCKGIFDHASDCLASKGVMVTRIKLSDAPGAELDVYNTHMEAGGGDEDEAVRAEQIQHLLKLMTTYSKGRAVLFMGDTNLHPHQDIDAKQIKILDEGAGLTELCAAVSCPEVKHIDRFHFRSSATLKLTAKAWQRDTSFVDDKGEDLSDHPAISARFRWAVTAP